MKITNLALGIILCNLLFYKNVYAGYGEDVAAINKGMPKSVQQFNLRQIECNHWAGEEPYDRERAKEIGLAVNRLKCDTLERYETRLRNKYKAKPKVIDSINKAKELI